MSSICQAAKNGDLVVVKAAVGNLSDIDKHDENGFSALHHACEQGHLHIVEYLVHQHADANDLTEGEERMFGEEAGDPKYPLHIAAGKGHLHIVELLLKNEVYVDCRTGRFANTALHFSSQFGHLAVANYLIMQGGSCHSTTTNKCTPLHRSCRFGQFALVQYLVNAGSDIDFTDNDGNSPLHCAINTSHVNLAIVKFLTEKGCNLRSTNKDGKTPLQLAREYILSALKSSL